MKRMILKRSIDEDDHKTRKRTKIDPSDRGSLVLGLLEPPLSKITHLKKKLVKRVPNKGRKITRPVGVNEP